MKKEKPYADKLYKKKNIIGYTGNVKNNPTVYFKMKHGDRSHVGHITQDHHNKSNIGRETALSGKNYKITNNNGQAIESINSQAYHKSRNKFITVSSSDKKTLNELEKAIKKFPKMKTIHKQHVEKVADLVKNGNKEEFEKLTGHLKAMGQYMKDKNQMKKNKSSSIFSMFTSCLNSKSPKSYTPKSPRHAVRKTPGTTRGVTR